MTDPLATLTETAALFGFTLEAAGPDAFYLSRQLDNGRAVAVSNDESSVEDIDPDAPMFLLGGIEPDEDMWDAPSTLYPDPMPLREALDKGQEIAESVLGAPATLDSGWRFHFPSYPVHAYPPVPRHWEDASWRNDGCPSVDGPYGFKVWINWPDPSHREDPEQKRFMVEDTSDPDSPIVFQSDSWGEIMSYIDEADWSSED
jgi:hypothetical protein